jgi:hypothetical protein
MILQTGHSKEWFSEPAVSLKNILITKKPFILMNVMNGSPKPVIQHWLAEQYCLGNSKTKHSKELFSEAALSLKIHSYR